MNDFIQMAVKQLGINQQSAQSATGGMLGFVQKAMGAGDFQKTLGGVPGLMDLVGKFGGGAAAPAQGGGGGGLGGALGGILGGGGSGGIGGMVSKLASNLPGGLGQVAGLVSLLSNSGISTDKAGGFAGMLMNYLKGHVGQGGIDQVLGKLPDLKKLIG